MTNKMTLHEPWSPDFFIEADWVMNGIPVTVETRNISTVRGIIAEKLQTMFVQGMQEARERIEHDK